MNCRQTRELVSAYSDQELTGRQMLEIGEHLSHCASCAREWREINEVRRILRGAHVHSPAPGAEQRLRDNVLLPSEPLWSILFSALTAPSPLSPARPRGRRLTSALALSSIAILCVAAPFAPQARDGARGDAETLATMPATGASMLPMPGTGWGLALLPFLHLTSASVAAPAPSATSEDQAGESQSLSSEDSGPLRNVTMMDYTESNAAWEEYRAANAGSR